MVVGDTVTEALVELIGAAQLYDVAPETVSVELCPGHIVAGDAVAITVGAGLTFTVTTLLVTDPHALLTTAW